MRQFRLKLAQEALDLYKAKSTETYVVTRRVMLSQVSLHQVESTKVHIESTQEGPTLGRFMSSTSWVTLGQARVKPSQFGTQSLI